MKLLNRFAIGAGIASATMLGLVSGAHADGMPSYAPAYRPALDPWSGLYVGTHAGYGWADNSIASLVDGNGDTVTCTTVAFGATVTPCNTSSPAGPFAGMQLGINHLLGPNFLVGLEFDYSAGNLTDTFSNFGTGGQSQTKETIDFFGSGRGRLGFVAGNFLIYGTGGVAFVHTVDDRTILQSGLPAFVGQTAHATGWNPGWVWGGGVEWACDPRFSIKLEYQHMEFDNVSRGFTYGGGTVAQNTTAFRQVTNDLNLDTVRIGFNLHLGRESYERLK